MIMINVQKKTHSKEISTKSPLKFELYYTNQKL